MVWRRTIKRPHFFNIFSIILVTSLLLSACNAGGQRREITFTTWKESIGIDAVNFDHSVRPQDDFYDYVNGRWLKNFILPSDRSSYGVFSEITERAEGDVAQIIMDIIIADGVKESPHRQMIKDLFSSFIDIEIIEEKGLGPIAPLLREIDAIDDQAALARYFAHAASFGLSSPLRLRVGPNMRDTRNYAVYISQSGLGMPGRNYYGGESESHDRLGEAYRQYMNRMFALLKLHGGEEYVDLSAGQYDVVFDLEHKIAAAHRSNELSRNRELNDNPFSFQQLVSEDSKELWQPFFEEIGDFGDTTIFIREPEFIEQLRQLMHSIPLAVWRNYLTFMLVSDLAEFLPPAFDQAQFEFFGRSVRGVSADRPRSHRAITFVNQMLPDALGQIFVNRHFTKDVESRTRIMVENIKAAFAERIRKLTWMTDQTKQEALNKLALFDAQIGHPKVWADYTSLIIDAEDLIGNILRRGHFEFKRELDKIGRPVDRDAWSISPQTANAYYSPTLNQLYLPAAILRPPFFNAEVDEAINYGAIGGVIGHEIIHGFDDQGRKSDGYGNLRNWWTPEDMNEFDRRAEKLVDQFSIIEPFPNEKLNGVLTLGENMGDLGGLTIAYDAYLKFLQRRPSPTILGFTGQQRFFLGWAQIWRRIYRAEELHRRLLVDNHAPTEYRVNTILSNMPAFYDAFDVGPTDALYRPPEDRVVIW